MLEVKYWALKDYLGLIEELIAEDERREEIERKNKNKKKK